MMNNLKKILKYIVLSVLFLPTLTVFAQEGAITVISREDGSGTRGAFVELAGVVDDAGDDMTTLDATVQNNTSAVMQAVSNDKQSIGYISLGSLDDSVKGVKVDGHEATADTIKAGDYQLARPFNLVYQEEGQSDLAKDFLNFILSTEGQAIIADNSFIQVSPKDQADAAEDAADTTEAYKSAGLEGELQVVGSTSVTPVMEKLAEEYQALNKGVTINITSNGSTAGVTSVQEKVADFGMVSRDLTDEEQKAMAHRVIALDGIAVIINKENDTDNLSLDQVKDIYLGEITDWSDL